MTSTLHPLNVLLAALFGAGIFALVLALTYQRPVLLSETERIYGMGAPALGWRERLQMQLDNARINLRAGEFVRVALFLAALGGSGGYLLSGAPIGGVLGAALGGAGYWQYLNYKARKALEAYEDDLPQVVGRLIAGARLGSSLSVAAEHVAHFGPLNCREDWAYIAAQLKAGASVEHVLPVIARKRGSQLLNALFELLLIPGRDGTGFTDILPLIQESLESRTQTMRRARTKLGGPIRELWIVCATPFVAVIFLRLLSPEFAAIYSTWTGQALLLVGWGIALGAFLLAQRSFGETLRRELSFGAALKAKPRTPPASQPPNPKGSVGRSQAPASLSRYTGPTESAAHAPGGAQ